MSERLENEGRLSETRIAVKEMALRVENLRDSLRRATDPFTPLKDLAPLQIQTLSFDLAARIVDYQELLNMEQALRRALGK